VLLFDEIDKAPPDLPNDLLLELSQFRFEVRELGNQPIQRRSEGQLVCILTSNGQRPLPDAFLRRCLHHHIVMDEARMQEIIERRSDGAPRTADLKVVMGHFKVLREQRELEHPPGFDELLTWWRALQLEATGLTAETEIAKLPFLEALLKTPEDVQRIRGGRGR
jgi:MoxR-like ATPase